MALRFVSHVCSHYFRFLRRSSYPLYRIPVRADINQIISGHRIARLPSLVGNVFVSSVASSFQETLEAASSYRLSSSLFKAYSGVTGSVQHSHRLSFATHHYATDINQLYRSMHNRRYGPTKQTFHASVCRYTSPLRWIFNSAALIPRNLLGSGCSSAVWAVDLAEAPNNKLAAKVLYNYYTGANTEGAEVDDVDWVLLHRQVDRECNLRPPTMHPNIVSVVGAFLDRAPATTAGIENEVNSITSNPYSLHDNLSDDMAFSEKLRLLAASRANYSSREVAPEGKQQTSTKFEGYACQQSPSPDWCGAEKFPEGFGGRPFTYYLLMPRFDATLQDLLSGAWHTGSTANKEQNTLFAENNTTVCSPENCSTTVVEHAESGHDSGSCFAVPSHDIACDATSELGHQTMSSTLMTSTGTNSCLLLDESVALLAQLFDAVAELERVGVAHRDIKPNNILLRKRSPPTTGAVEGQDHLLSGIHVTDANTDIQVALTDFGCAIRTSPTGTCLSTSDWLFGSDGCCPPHLECEVAHSGNVALLPPEVATLVFGDAGHRLTGADYSRADIWAAATLAYPLFGVNNPFLNQALSSLDYSEHDLPPLPEAAPGVVHWLVQSCLRRKPSDRPPANLVADVLHTWCLIRQFNRQCHPHNQLKMGKSEGVSSVLQLSQLPQTDLLAFLDRLIPSSKESVCRDSVGADVDNTDITTPCGSNARTALALRLRSLLNLLWTADWLLGPARPPDGLRVSFYRRITLPRLATCLLVLLHHERLRAFRVSQWISQALETVIMQRSHSEILKME